MNEKNNEELFKNFKFKKLNPKNRKIEELCRRNFDLLIKKTNQYQYIKWCDVPRNCDPPDYYLLLREELFAVEVTSTPVEKTEVNSLFDLLYKIEEEVKSKDDYYGYYEVSLEGIFSEFRKKKKQIKRKIIDFIELTQTEKATDYKTIIQDETASCKIKKNNNQNTRIGWRYNNKPIKIKENPSICKSLVQQAVDKKVKKLKKIYVKKILLIYNSYSMGFPDTYKSVIEEVNNKEFFEMIVLVESDKAIYLWHKPEAVEFFNLT